MFHADRRTSQMNANGVSYYLKDEVMVYLYSSYHIQQIDHVESRHLEGHLLQLLLTMKPRRNTFRLL